MMDNIKALNRLETTKDYLKELYREQVKNCPYPELKPIAKQTYEDNQMAFNIAIKAIKESNRQQAEIERLTKEGEKLQYKLECLLCHSTGSKLSKSTYSLRTMEMYVNDYIQECCEEAQAEAVKEFAERLKAVSHPYANTQMVFELQIDNLVKEMVGK